MKQLHNERGSILLEAIIALGVIMIIAVAMSIAVTLSVSNSTFIRNQNLANKYAQEGIEVMREQEETDYTAFRSHVGSTIYCFDGSFELQSNCPYVPPPPSQADPNPPGPDAILSQGFTRTIAITSTCAGDSDPADVQVTVKVAWANGACTQSNTQCHSVQLQSCFPAIAQTQTQL